MMRVIMPAIIDQAGRQFNADEADGVNRRHTARQRHDRPRGGLRRCQIGRKRLGLAASVANLCH
jgi:hypothetical protein